MRNKNEDEKNKNEIKYVVAKAVITINIFNLF